MDQITITYTTEVIHRRAKDMITEVVTIHGGEIKSGKDGRGYWLAKTPKETGKLPLIQFYTSHGDFTLGTGSRDRFWLLILTQDKPWEGDLSTEYLQSLRGVEFLIDERGPVAQVEWEGNQSLLSPLQLNDARPSNPPIWRGQTDPSYVDREVTT
jgi:hypothetical protein